MEGLIIDEEGLTVDLESDNPAVQVLENCLISRILTDKYIRAKYLEERISRFWKTGKGLAVIPVESNTNRFLLQFGHKADVERVLRDGPWLYDNASMIIQKITPGEVAKEVPLDKLELWVQVHGLPLGYTQEKTGKGCGAFLGAYREYDVKNELHSKYMRIRVGINVSQPLKRDMKLRNKNGECVTVKFKYERLGTFCYRCGILGHLDRNCPKMYDEEIDDGVRLWSEELKAEYKGNSAGQGNKWTREVKDMMKEADRIYAEKGKATENATSGVADVKKGKSQAMSSTVLEAVSSKVNNVGVLMTQSAADIEINKIMDPENYLLLNNTPADEVDEGSELRKRKRNNVTIVEKNQEVNLHESHGSYYNKQGECCFGVIQKGSLADASMVSSTRNNPLYDSQIIAADPGYVQDCRDK